MSRRPTPSAINKLHGNPGNRAINTLEPEPQLGVPEKPKGMGTAANRIWDRFVRELMEMKVLSIVDGVALREACISAALAEKFSREVLDEPMVDEPCFDKDGNLVGTKRKVNPATAGYITCSKNMKAFLLEFGLTPASRSKLKIEKPKPNQQEEDGMLSRDAAAERRGNDEPNLDAIDLSKVM